jgi:D-alanyl-D-alanine carboxypeptidase/D-alanyl-D-alanine-endopeptidase (penicillin-binding protein 4)
MQRRKRAEFHIVYKFVFMLAVDAGMLADIRSRELHTFFPYHHVLPRFVPIHIVLILAGLMFSASALAGDVPSIVSGALKRAEIPLSAVGVFVQEVNGQKALVALNSARPLNPASTMKLVTTNAALELLGPTFTWKTQAYATGVQAGDVLQGDLIIKGGGDPKLVIENFWLFLRQIRARGIRKIAGNVLLDRSVFEEAVYDPAKFDGDPAKPYNAGPDALLLNFNSFRFRFTPNPATGSVKVLIDPPVVGYPVAPPRLTSDDCGDWQGKLHASLPGVGAHFDGTYATSCGEKVWYVHPYQMTHTQYFAMVFRQMWSDMGGELVGEVKSGTVPADVWLVAEWESAPLPDAIRDINKYSNNVMARQLLLTLAANMLKVPATPQGGARVVKNWLAAKEIDAPELVIENGAGLSRDERISVETMGKVLIAAFKSPLMPEYISSMPLVGYDGTMRSRLKNQSVAGNAHIKTGRLDDVKALAGYVLAASGKQYVVVCIINHRNAGSGQEAQDALLEWVYEKG